MSSTNTSPTVAFAGKTVFLTGGTGFFGKALIEKLLRSAPSIAKIFVLIRAREDGPVLDRLEKEIISSPIFDRLRRDLGSSEVADEFLRSKLTAVAGDVTSPQLGLSANDQRTLRESVQISIHSAATVRFNEPLDVAVRMNCRGAINVVDFVQTCQNVQCHMHVSTAYVNSNQRGEKITVREELYPLDFDVEEAYVAVSKAPPSELETLHKRLIGTHPNTYTLTKSMAEHLIVKRAGPKIPVVMFRPTVIGCSWQEPVPGWIDQVAGAGALFLSVGMGTITIFPGKPDYVTDVVPVDLSVNTALVAIVATLGGYRDDATGKPLIVHSGTSEPNPLHWGLPSRLVPAYFRENPSSKSPLRSKFRIVKAYPLFKTQWFFKYTVPAAVYSAVAKLSCSDRKITKATKLKKATRRASKLVDALKPFADDQWIFKTDSKAILEQFAGDSTESWWLDATDIDWDKYISNFCVGLKKYVLHEEAECV